MLHDTVVSVGIDFEIAALGESPVQTERSGSFHGAVGCDAVNDCVRGFIQPLAGVDPAVSVVRAFFNKKKSR